MYRISLLSVMIAIGVESASYYPRSYGDSSGYPSSTISNLNDNFPYGKSVSYGSDLANFPEVTRYPSYSPGYGYSTPGYTSYSSAKYPRYNNNNNGYSTNSYNNLYNGGSSNGNYNQGFNSYGTGYGSGPTYGTGYGSGSTYGTGYGSGSTYGTGYGSGSTYGTGYGSGSGSAYGSGYASGYSNYGKGSTMGGSSLGGYSPYEAPFMTNQNLGGCVNRSPQNGIWVDSLMGMWFGVEYIQHLGVDSRVDYAESCIVIHIAEPMDRPSTENQPFHMQAINAKFRQEYRHLRLLWDESGFKTEYALYFRNDSAGYWHVVGRQNGTQAVRDSYQHFGGTIQVLKAVNDHLLLNFCQEGDSTKSPQLYSVLFSRNPRQMDRWTIDSVHGLLQNKKLSTASRRMVCGNSAERAAYSAILSILTCLLAYVMRSS